MLRFRFYILHHMLIGFLFATVFFGCAALDPPPDPPDVMLNDAISFIKAENYSDAAEKLADLLQEYPDSRERVTAQLLLADTHFSMEEYEEAKFHYHRFLELYPVHKRAAHAMYFLGMCDFAQMDISTRDQTYSQDAMKAFDRLLEEHPNSQYTERARTKRAESLRSIAENQLEIGKFYFRISSYQSAINRFKRLIKKYPDQGFTDEAIFLLGESYYGEESFDTARKYYKQLVREYPRSPFVREARTRLHQIH